MCAGFLIWFFDTPEAQDPILATNTPNPEARGYVVVTEESELSATADTPGGPLSSTFQMGPGSIELQQEAGGWRVAANLTFDATTLDVGNDEFNVVVRRLLEVDKYPTGSFVASSDALLTDLDDIAQINLVGQLELLGYVQEYSIPTTITFGDGQISMSSKTVIDAAIFGDDIPGMPVEQGMNAILSTVALEAEE